MQIDAAANLRPGVWREAWPARRWSLQARRLLLAATPDVGFGSYSILTLDS